MASAIVGVFNTILGGIFSHHAQAVKNQADALQAAVPEALTSYNNLVNALNNGTITPQEAPGYIDSILAEYENVVYQQYKVKKQNCNGPCVVENQFTTFNGQLKAAISAGKGSVSIGPFFHLQSGYREIPTQTYTVSIPSPATVGVNSVLSSFGINAESFGDVTLGTHKIPVLYVAGVLFLLMFLLLLGKPKQQTQPQIIVVRK